jgi:hypothetical protein
MNTEKFNYVSVENPLNCEFVYYDTKLREANGKDRIYNAA